MKAILIISCLVVFAILYSPAVIAGPYSGAMGYSDEIPNPDATDIGIPGFVGPDGDGKCLTLGPNNYVNPLFVGWATGWQDYLPSDEEWSGGWDDPNKAMSEVTGDHFDVVSLGDLDTEEILNAKAPGEITLTFDMPICNGEGADFAVFENTLVSFYTTGDGSLAEEIFAELAYVEVSTDGINFVRFPCDSLTPPPSGSALYLTLNPTEITNLVGKHANQAGYSWGTPFDLDELSGFDAVAEGLVNLNEINFVRIVDIPGTGDFTDASGDPIYDAWLSWGSGGVDLEALGIIHTPGWLVITSIPDGADIYIDGEITGMLTGESPISLPVDSYEISVRAAGYSPWEDTVTVTAGDTTVISAELTPNPGDINGDGAVNLTDFVLLRNSFGLSEGEPNYNPDADLNGSGKVDLTDFVILRNNFTS